jgi:DNA-binding HxlR family transcriptional regulator
MSSSAELFEKIAHPTRIRILEVLESTPLSFGKLKNELGISSSGNLDYHLKKLEELIVLDPEGNYRLSDEGKEALVAVRIIESSAAARDQAGQRKTGFADSISNVFILIWMISAFVSFGVVSYLALGQPLGYSIGQGSFISLFMGVSMLLIRWIAKRMSSQHNVGNP